MGLRLLRRWRRSRHEWKLRDRWLICSSHQIPSSLGRFELKVPRRQCVANIALRTTAAERDNPRSVVVQGLRITGLDRVFGAIQAVSNVSTRISRIENDNLAAGSHPAWKGILRWQAISDLIGRNIRLLWSNGQWLSIRLRLSVHRWLDVALWLSRDDTYRRRCVKVRPSWPVAVVSIVVTVSV